MEKEMIYKSRGFSSCINSAYHLMGDNMKSIIRGTWLPALLVSLFSGIVATLYIPSDEILSFGLAHTGLYFTLFYGSVLGILICHVWLYSRLMSVLNDQPRLWNFKRVLLSILYAFLIGFLVGFVVVSAFYLGLRMTGGNPTKFLFDNWLVVLIVLILIILALLPFNYIIMRYLYDKDARFWGDLPKTYKTGLRHLGFIFITTLLTSIIVGLIVMVVSLPLNILNIANLLSYGGRQMGDPVTLPGYFLPLFFFTMFLVTIALLYVYMFQFIVYLFVYGSIEKSEEERKKMGSPRKEEFPTSGTFQDKDPHLPLQQLT